jgi:hypothetical protein
MKKLIMMVAGLAMLTASANAGPIMIPVTPPEDFTYTRSNRPGFVTGKLYQMGVEMKNHEKKTYPGVFAGWVVVRNREKGDTADKLVSGHIVYGDIYAVFTGDHTTLLYKTPSNWFIMAK